MFDVMERTIQLPLTAKRRGNWGEGVKMCQTRWYRMSLESVQFMPRHPAEFSRTPTFNKIGSGAASKLETATTKGGKPKEPSVNPFLQVNRTSVTLFLSTWQDGGCPILYFVVEYRKGKSDWTLVSNNVLPQPKFPIIDMTPATQYTLRVTAHNNAGSTQAEYKFTTLNNAGGEHLPETKQSDNSDEVPFYRDSHMVILSIASLIAVILAMAGVCFCLRRKPESEDMSLHESQTAAALDNKQNMEQREQYYATVRKPIQSPMHDMSGLERIPEYSEDIYPYATFHLPEQENMSSNPQLRQSFGYEPRISDAPQIKQGEIDHYSKVRHRQRRKSKSFKSESEEYDTLGSDSDTEQGTSSRTESSNHLDDPGSGPGPGLGPGTSRAGAGIHKPVHHNFLYHAHESSTSTEPSPISERKSFPRHGKFRENYCFDPSSHIKYANDGGRVSSSTTKQHWQWADVEEAPYSRNSLCSRSKVGTPQWVF